MSSTESFNITIRDIPNGAYFLGVLVDYKSSLQDKEFCIYESPRIIIGDEEGIKSNLTCGNMGSLTIDGQTVKIEGFEVTNIGEGTAGKSFVGVYLSNDQNFDPSDVNIAELEVQSLSPGGIREISFTTEVEEVPVGTYYIGLKVGNKGINNESNFQDNTCFYVSPRLSIRDFIISQGKPNLVCGSLGKFNGFWE